MEENNSETKKEYKQITSYSKQKSGFGKSFALPFLSRSTWRKFSNWNMFWSSRY